MSRFCSYLTKLISCLAVFIALTGCSYLGKQEQVQYQTVAANTHHDTASARQKHQEALVLLENAHCPRDYSRAEALLNEALVADVTYGPAHNSLGSLYYSQDKM